MSDEDFDFGDGDEDDFGFEEYDGEGEGEGEGEVSLEEMIHSNYVNGKSKYKDDGDVASALSLFRDVWDIDSSLDVCTDTHIHTLI
jgi:hypothetical protein